MRCKNLYYIITFVISLGALFFWLLYAFTQLLTYANQTPIYTTVSGDPTEFKWPAKGVMFCNPMANFTIKVLDCATLPETECVYTMEYFPLDGGHVNCIKLHLRESNVEQVFVTLDTGLEYMMRMHRGEFIDTSVALIIDDSFVSIEDYVYHVSKIGIGRTTSLMISMIKLQGYDGSRSEDYHVEFVNEAEVLDMQEDGTFEPSPFVRVNIHVAGDPVKTVNEVYRKSWEDALGLTLGFAGFLFLIVQICLAIAKRTTKREETGYQHQYVRVPQVF